ncbi:hypothetical protein [Actinoplanes aureus]|uniref:Uncharacterized protein n=1 Tax=Actinoplanes aureus TaxID=2792083 RepID=A0A931CJI2_9ACTN|nr:hypothetical protein [Actinoplanes aureus]MBG0569162.1 hypothetical protein [Actinoplanes aureus]
MPAETSIYAQALQAIGETAQAYEVRDDTVARYRARMRESGPLGYAEGGMSALIVQTATEHRRDCRRPDCRTCGNLREVLAVALAGARELVDHEIASMVDSNRRRPRLLPKWRRGGVR